MPIADVDLFWISLDDGKAAQVPLDLRFPFWMAQYIHQGMALVVVNFLLRFIPF